MISRSSAANPASWPFGASGETNPPTWRAVPHGHRLVVASDRDVEQGLEDPELGGEQPVHRGLRGVRAVADRLDGRGGGAALDEQALGRLDDGRPGGAGG